MRRVYLLYAYKILYSGKAKNLTDGYRKKYLDKISTTKLSCLMVEIFIFHDYLWLFSKPFPA